MNSYHTFALLAYKKSQFIENCIKSLMNQTVNSKIIISTSTPSDFIDSLAKKYNLPLHTNKDSTGISSDWSFAYNTCNSRYVTLAHQDDLYCPNYTEKSIQKIDAENSLISFTGYSELFNDKMRYNNLNLTIKKIILLPFFTGRHHLHSKVLKRLLLSFGSPICCPSVMFNKEKIGRISFNPKFTIDTDWNMWLDLAEKNGAFTFTPERLVIHRIHSASATSNGLIKNRRQSEDKLMFMRIWPGITAKIVTHLYSFSYLSNFRE